MLKKFSIKPRHVSLWSRPRELERKVPASVARHRITVSLLWSLLHNCQIASFRLSGKVVLQLFDFSDGTFDFMGNQPRFHDDLNISLEAIPVQFQWNQWNDYVNFSFWCAMKIKRFFQIDRLFVFNGILMRFFFVSDTRCYNVTSSNKTPIWTFGGLSSSPISYLFCLVSSTSPLRLNSKVSICLFPRDAERIGFASPQIHFCSCLLSPRALPKISAVAAAMINDKSN